MSDRGFITYAPRAQKVKGRLRMIEEILEEYEAELPLTMRQIFYRAVGKYDYEKTEAAYKRLLYIGRKARRGRHIAMDVIRDDGVSRRKPFAFSGITDFRDYLAIVAKEYETDRQIDQDRKLIVLCEAAGMVPQLARVCLPYGVPAQSSGGYDSVTVKYHLAKQIVRQGPTTILHIGVLDPSGEDMFTVIKEDVGTFVEQMGGDCEAIRVAVTREQAIELDLSAAPAKPTDSRSKNFEGLGDDLNGTVQCEAIPPDELARILRNAIELNIDPDIYQQTLEREHAERQHAISIIETANWSE